MEILVRVVEGRSGMAAAVRLLTRIADYASQWLEKRVNVKKHLKESLKVGAMWRQP